MKFTSETAREMGLKSKRGMSERTKILNDLFDAEKATAVFRKVEALAVEGDMEAIKLYLAYCFGKPKESVDITSDGERIGGYTIEVIRTPHGQPEIAN